MNLGVGEQSGKMIARRERPLIGLAGEHLEELPVGRLHCVGAVRADSLDRDHDTFLPAQITRPMQVSSSSPRSGQSG